MKTKIEQCVYDDVQCYALFSSAIEGLCSGAPVWRLPGWLCLLAGHSTARWSACIWTIHQLRHCYWLFNRLSTAVTNENDAIGVLWQYYCPTWDHHPKQMKHVSWNTTPPRLNPPASSSCVTAKLAQMKMTVKKTLVIIIIINLYFRRLLVCVRAGSFDSSYG